MRDADGSSNEADMIANVAMSVRPLEGRDADSCDGVIDTLPYHFGDPDGRAECARAVRSQAGLVAEDDGEVVGFLTFQPRFDDATEITWMAVRADRRRRGIGRLLIERLVESVVADRRLLIVLTVSPSDGPDEIENGYDATRSFYRSCGFALTRDFPGYWSGTDTPVLLVRVLR